MKVDVATAMCLFLMVFAEAGPATPMIVKRRSRPL